MLHYKHEVGDGRRVGTSALRGLLAALRNGRMLALMFGHMTVDSYVGVPPILFPVLIGRFHVNLATVGLVSLFYSLS